MRSKRMIESSSGSKCDITACNEVIGLHLNVNKVKDVRINTES